MKISLLLLLLGLISMPAYAIESINSAPKPLPAEADAKLRAEIKPVRASKIILVGDSTTANFGGWGPSFCAYHVRANLACINLARAGRSSFSYRAEGSWNFVMAEAGAGQGVYDKTYVLIQFGHNDQPGKPGRSTDLVTEFPHNLEQFIDDVRAVGAIPVLVTPMTRRGFRNGKLDDSLRAWADAVRQVAQAKQTPLVDLYARSYAAVQAMGPIEAMKFAISPPPQHVREAALSGTTISGNSPAPSTEEQRRNQIEPVGQAKSSFDYTHLGREGADYFSKIVVEELSKVLPEAATILLP